MVPANFVPSAVFFDMDATVIREESLDEISRNYGVYDQVAAITEQAMSGAIDFSTSLKLRLALIKGAPESILNDFTRHYQLNSGVEKLINFLHGISVPTFLVSGGFSHVASHVQKRLNIEGSYANQLEIVDGVITGGITGQIVDAAMKKSWMLDVIDEYGFDPSAIVAVGDGANDQMMLDAASLAIGFRPKSVLYPFLDAHIGSDTDHTFLISVLQRTNYL